MGAQMSIDNCPECQVPKAFSEIQAWLNNGDIVQSLNDKARIAFIESEHLDPLFKNIEEILGIPIEHLLINIASRANALAMSLMIPKAVRDMVKSGQLEVMPFIEGITILAQTCGLARYELLGFRYEQDEDDYCHHRVYNPYSLPMSAGNYVGSVMSVVEGQHAVETKRLLPDVYEFKTHWDKYPLVLNEKMRLVEYHHSEGDLDLERCPSCGAPKSYTAYEWFPEKGLIRNRATKHRMVLVGPEVLDPMFRALISEIGPVMQNVIIEAECKVTRNSFSPIDITQDSADIRLELASKGFGNLKELSVGREKMSVFIDNACFHFVLAGMFQGAFERTFEVDSDIEWELRENNKLELLITPEKVIVPAESR
jgi:hypothetical protein